PGDRRRIHRHPEPRQPVYGCVRASDSDRGVDRRRLRAPHRAGFRCHHHERRRDPDAVESPALLEAHRPASRAGGGRVSLIIQAFAWIFDAAHWKTTATLTGIPDALAQHLVLTGLSLA